MRVKTTHRFSAYGLLILLPIWLTSCYTEDPGPMQEAEKIFHVTDFDKVELGDAFRITIEQSEFFEVWAHGDQRNLNDLEVFTQGNTLIARYKNNRDRRYATKINIKMPVLQSAVLSGATDSRISGFEGLEKFDLYLSGASHCQLKVVSRRVNVTLSGASYLNLGGDGESLKAKLSGASVLKAFNFPVLECNLNVTGASEANVTVNEKLDVEATGASVVLYRGNPVVNSNTSGFSTVQTD